MPFQAPSPSVRTQTSHCPNAPLILRESTHQPQAARSALPTSRQGADRRSRIAEFGMRTPHRSRDRQGAVGLSVGGHRPPALVDIPSASVCPAGTTENSPAIHRWVTCPGNMHSVPSGRLRCTRPLASDQFVSVVPTGLDATACPRSPSLERLGYSHQALRAYRRRHSDLNSSM